MFSPNRLFKVAFVLVAWLGCAAQDTTRANLTGVPSHNKLGKIITVVAFNPNQGFCPGVISSQPASNTQ